MVPLVNIMLGEIIFGGVGSGLYGMLIFCILAVFIAGLMVGRTPEYLGKKIESYDVKMSMLYVLIFPLVTAPVGLAAILLVAGLIVRRAWWVANSPVEWTHLRRDMRPCGARTCS